jgi:hypothetical protein
MTGAERAQTEPGQGFTAATDSDWLGPPVEAEAPTPEASAEPARAKRPAPPRLLGALLILLALGWVAAVGLWLWQARPPLSLGNGIAWTATLAGPLALLALLWLMFGRTSRREAERFTRAVEQMTVESRALESVLEIVASRIEDNHSRLRGEAERLMSLGDEASDRLGRVTYYLSKETATLDQKAAALDSAANAAKVDIGVLLHDLPRAEAQARAVADAMKEAGLNAHGQASALEAQLGALAARGRDADEVLGGAAQRMSAHVARIESGSAAAAASMDESSAKMTGAVDGAMSRAAEAVETARAALELQGRPRQGRRGQRPKPRAAAGDDQRQDRGDGRPYRRPGRRQPRFGHRPGQGACRAGQLVRAARPERRRAERAARPIGGDHPRGGWGAASGAWRRAGSGQRIERTRRTPRDGPGRHFVGAEGGSPGGARELRGAGGARPRGRRGDRAGRR